MRVRATEDRLQGQESKVSELTIELGRCRSQVRGLEQYKEYMEKSSQ